MGEHLVDEQVLTRLVWLASRGELRLTHLLNLGNGFIAAYKNRSVPDEFKGLDELCIPNAALAYNIGHSMIRLKRIDGGDRGDFSFDYLDISLIGVRHFRDDGRSPIRRGIRAFRHFKNSYCVCRDANVADLPDEYNPLRADLESLPRATLAFDERYSFVPERSLVRIMR